MPDPIADAGWLGGTGAGNAYGYASSNPLRFVDPSGMQSQKPEVHLHCSGNQCWLTVIVSSGYAGVGAIYNGQFMGMDWNQWSAIFDVPVNMGTMVPTPLPAGPSGLGFQNREVGGQGRPANTGDKPAGHNFLNRVKSAYCSAVPSGRSASVGIAFGAVGSVGASVDTVFNYNSGQTSVFASGGGGLGWNGAASLTVSTGFVWGLDGTNGAFSGVSKGGNVYAPTPLPLLSAGGSIVRGSGVTVVSGGVSVALAGRVGFGASVYDTSRPLDMAASPCSHR